MQNYQGSCHCGKVQFEIKTDLNKVIQCNCSICVKKGALHHRVSNEQFQLIAGEEYLTLYQYNTRKAKHYFCKVCGMHPFSRPRSAPDTHYSINVHCLDNFDFESSQTEMIQFDGKNYEQTIEQLNNQIKKS